MGWGIEVVKRAKDISSISSMPVPRVSAVLQPDRWGGSGLTIAHEDCLALGKPELEKTLKRAFNL
jgi:hypothetical protein